MTVEATAEPGPVTDWLASQTSGTLRVMSETAEQRTERADFQATSDPGLLESADRGEVHLLSYEELYNLWERQQWATQDLDFTQDRIDWHERIPEEERFQRMYGLSSFFIGEQKVAEELGPMMRAAPTEEMRIFLCTQIADEARHVRFFNRFYDEVGVLEATNLQDRLAETSAHVNPEFDQLFDEMLKSRVDHLARRPEDLVALVEAITLYHMVIEGMLALTGQHFILQYNEEVGTLPGFVEGFNKIARDEHRHVAFGARFLREMAQEDPKYGDAITRTLTEVAPIADGVLQPKWYVEGETEVLGATMEETRAFAMKALERRLKVIGLAPVTTGVYRRSRPASSRSPVTVAAPSPRASRSRPALRLAADPPSAQATSNRLWLATPTCESAGRDAVEQPVEQRLVAGVDLGLGGVRRRRPSGELGVDVLHGQVGALHEAHLHRRPAGAVPVGDPRARARRATAWESGR